MYIDESEMGQELILVSTVIYIYILGLHKQICLGFVRMHADATQLLEHADLSWSDVDRAISLLDQAIQEAASSSNKNVFVLNVLQLPW